MDSLPAEPLHAPISPLASWTVHSLTSETNQKAFVSPLDLYTKRYNSLWLWIVHPGISNLATYLGITREALKMTDAQFPHPRFWFNWLWVWVEHQGFNSFSCYLAKVGNPLFWSGHSLCQMMRFPPNTCKYLQMFCSKYIYFLTFIFHWDKRWCINSLLFVCKESDCSLNWEPQAVYCKWYFFSFKVKLRCPD